ncbi:MAG: hypothetical protein HY897_07580 [Deltaproteobacteria bacterium]|nr:hypothetical protein [Deltaproteobacteria bacterium]
MKITAALSVLLAVMLAATAAFGQAQPPPPAVPQPEPAAAPPPAAPPPAPPAPAKKEAPKTLSVAFFQLEAQHVDPKTAAIVSDELLVLLSKMPGSNVMGSKEVDAMLGYEQKKQMSGCTDTSCMVAIGGALGVDKILMGSLGKLGESYILSLKLLDIRLGKVEQLYSKRLRGGKEEDFLDILPEACAAMFPASASIWVKTAPTPDKPPDQIQVVDLQRTPGAIKLPEKKPDEPTPAQAMAKKASEPPKAEPAPVTEVSKPVEPEKPEEPGKYSHDGQVLIALKGNGIVVPEMTSSVELHLGYSPSRWVEIGVGAIAAAAPGVAPRLTIFVYNPGGAVKPFIGLHAPIMVASEGIFVGVGGSLGIQWDFWKHMGLTAEVPVNYIVSAPDDFADPLIVMGTAGLQVRF